MKVKEFVNKLNIDDSEGKYTDTSFTVSLKDSNEFARMYSVFDNMKDSIADVHMTENHSVCDFSLEDFDVTLDADLEEDYYTLTITEVSE